METVLEEGGDGRVVGVRSGRAAADRAGALSAPLGGCLATDVLPYGTEVSN